MKLSKNFSSEELSRTDDRELLEANQKEALEIPEIKANLTKVANDLLEPIRTLFKKSVFVHSGYRGRALNEKVGGSKTSQHCLGEAADFHVDGYADAAGLEKAIYKIRDELPNLKFGQLLIENGCLHISLGTKREVAKYSVATKTKEIISIGK